MMNEHADLNLTHIARPSPYYGKGNAPERGVPGLLMLHGRGSDEYDLMGLQAALDPRLTIVSARAPYRLGEGYEWYVLPQIGQPDEETLHAGLHEAQEFVNGVVQAYNIDPQQLYLLGFSQGAILSAALALTIPEKIKGVIMHSGYVPYNTTLNLKPDAIAGKPFFIAHGMYDDVIPVDFGRDAEYYLSTHKARLTYREYPIGHSISEESLYELSEWLTNEVDNFLISS